jgi:predicted metal-dependent hydrolase
MRLFPFLKTLHPLRRKRRVKRHDWEKAAVRNRHFADGDIVSYLGHPCRLRITRADKIPQGCRLRPRRFEVNIHGENLSAKILREEIRLEIRLWLKKRAKSTFARRMEFWTQKLGVSCRQMIVTSPRSRWGSCNAKNVIRLNWHLVMAPLPLIDYVVAHELCHITHKNHARGFWNMLAAVMPDYRERRKRLRHLGRGLVV